MTEQKVQLEQQLWNIANTLLRKINTDNFRDYIFVSAITTLFIFANVLIFENPVPLKALHIKISRPFKRLCK